MAMSALQDQIREMLQCKICFEDKDNQKQLPCQHTLCLTCLNNLELESSRYKCPICQQENLIPNGGFEALPESLLTRQLANLIHVREWNVGRSISTEEAQSAAADGEKGTTETAGSNPQTEAARKLNFGIRKGTEILESADEKVKAYTELKENVVKNKKEIIDKLQNITEETISKLRLRVTKKVEAIEQLSVRKSEEIGSKISKLEKVYREADEAVKLLKERVEELESSSESIRQTTDINSDMQKAQTAVQSLKDEIMSGTDSSAGNFKPGDSVTLKIDPSLIKPNFMDKDITHASVGYIHEMNSKGDCAVIFPGSSAWVGNTKTLEKSLIKHDLPVIGDRVRVRPSISEPLFGWGKVKPESIGILKALKNRGPEQGREISVEFPENDSWKGIFDELEKVAAEPLKVGDEVWIAKDVAEPVGGWAGVTSTSVGTLLSVNSDDVVVNFPECEQWKGLLCEIERTRPIMVGDKVRVLKTVEEPKTGWAGVTHKDEGVVKLLKDHSEYGKVAGIDFPNRLGLWNCLVSELELVNRHSSSSGSGGIEIDPRDALEAMKSVNERLMSDFSKQQCHTQ